MVGLQGQSVTRVTWAVVRKQEREEIERERGRKRDRGGVAGAVVLVIGPAVRRPGVGGSMAVTSIGVLRARVAGVVWLVGILDSVDLGYGGHVGSAGS
jgi:hypothetical protein